MVINLYRYGFALYPFFAKCLIKKNSSVFLSSTTTGTIQYFVIQYFVILRKQKLFKSDSVRILQGTGTGTGTLQINFYYSTATPI